MRGYALIAPGHVQTKKRWTAVQQYTHGERAASTAAGGPASYRRLSELCIMGRRSRRGPLRGWRVRLVVPGSGGGLGKGKGKGNNHPRCLKWWNRQPKNHTDMCRVVRRRNWTHVHERRGANRKLRGASSQGKKLAQRHTATSHKQDGCRV